VIAKAVIEYGNQWPIRWVHIGDGPEMNSLRSIVQNRTAQTEVELLGQLSNNEVMDAYRTFKPWVFVNVSETEGVPVSIMEAMSFGVPVIATDVGGTSELVNSMNGFLVESCEPLNVLSNTIRKYKSLDSELQQQLSNFAKKNIAANFSAEKNFSDFTFLLLHI
jgi:glycosyltransferase involved in cell wall biosynthesis